MHYHTPDNIWTIFSGVTDFESYAEKFVVKGRFHKDVPPEVVEGYAIAEHIMAHAYYHYPAMDEALVKLLRVLEMAVKMRCKELGITLEILDNKGKTRKKVLNALINELAAKEAAKPTKSTLIWLKDVRNYLMHPSEPSLFGSVALGHIRQCVIMLNALFLPDRYFQDATDRVGAYRKGIANNLKRGFSCSNTPGIGTSFTGASLWRPILWKESGGSCVLFMPCRLI
jgi:hypothetical protein